MWIQPQQMTYYTENTPKCWSSVLKSTLTASMWIRSSRCSQVLLFYSTMGKIIHRWKTFTRVANLPRSGRPCKFTPRSDRAMLRETANNPTYPSCHWVRGGLHPGWVASPSQGHTETNETHNHAHSHSDLNIIEAVWDHFDRKRNKRQPTSKGELCDVLQEAWRTIPEDYLKKCCSRLLHIAV